MRSRRKGTAAGLLRALLALPVLVAAAAPPPARALSVPPMRGTLLATLAQPVALAARAGDDALYVVEKPGRVVAIRDGIVDSVPVLDITGQVTTGLEQGLLGLAFSPDGSYLYVDYTDTSGHTRLVEYAFADGRAQVSSRRQLLLVNQPYANHNGGTLRFGPDGYLYFGLGDGGGAGDPQGNAQRLDRLLGKILRIDPRGAQPYAIPPTNPFVGVAGARAEIWSYGLRNPWQLSFDRATGDLWIADVGQDLWEEINRQPASSGGGENYGWRETEGTHPYRGGSAPANHTPPVYEYPHPVGCSITGGFVYRGARIDDLQGLYVFGDFCAGRLWTLQEVGGARVAVESGVTIPAISAFGEDRDGELYALSYAGGVFRLDPIV